MRPPILIALAALPVLAGCGLPPALTIASYAIDGAILAATGKTSKDHALSAAMQQDCNVMRAVVADDICQPYEPAPRARWALETMGPTEEFLMATSDGRVIRVATEPPSPHVAPREVVAAAAAVQPEQEDGKPEQ